MMLKVLTGPIDVIAQKRATATTLLPPRSEHEVIDDELAASLEQIRERHLPVRPFEEIGLVDLHPGQLTSLPAHFIVFSRGFLLFDQEPPAGSDPFLLRYNFWMFDFDVVHRWIVWTHFQAVFPINDEQAVALGTLSLIIFSSKPPLRLLLGDFAPATAPMRNWMRARANYRLGAIGTVSNGRVARDRQTVVLGQGRRY